MGRVNVVSPTGAEGSVDESEASALPPGWKLATAPEPENDAGNSLEAGVLGMGRSATMGLSDLAISEASNLAGGEGARKRALSGLSDLREKHGVASTTGELGGLFLGAGEAIPAVGEAAERGLAGALAPRIGEGLLSHVAPMAARGAVEGTLLGAQNQITEDTLGDHQYNAEAIFSSAAKDMLLGGATGASLGLIGAGARGLLGRSSGLLSKPGPMSDATLDEVAGVDGAGRRVAAAADRDQSFVEGMQRTGATSDQASQVAKDLETLGKSRPNAGIGDGVLDWIAEKNAELHGADNPERAKLMTQHYADVERAASHEAETLDTSSRKLAEAGTKAMRLEDTLGHIQFGDRPNQIEKLVDPSRAMAARDAAINMGQDVQAAISELDATATKGGGEVGLNRLKKYVADFNSKMESVSADGGGATGARDSYINAYKLKQAVGKVSGFGKLEIFRTDAERIFGGSKDIAGVYNSLQRGLEDSNVFGAAGDATRALNQAVSDRIPRRNHFGSLFSDSIDQVSGVPVPELNAGKLKGFLQKLGGSEADQGVTSTEAFIDGLRNWTNKIEQHASLTEADRTALSDGRAAIDDFEKTFRDSVKEAEASNRVRAATISEQGHGVGGLLGLITDIATRPFTTQRRLASIGTTARTVEGHIRSGVRKVLDVKPSGRGVPANLPAPRAKDVIIKEMESIRSMAGDQPALERASARIVGDLGKYAPQTADQLRLTAQRTLLYLAREAPPASTTENGLFGETTSRYSDIQVHDWETKRHAAFDVRTVINDMQHGILNRDAIEAAEFAQPKLFANMQQIAQEEIQKLRARGELDDMAYQQKAPFAALLGVPADQTWTPEFMGAMQLSKAAAASAPQGNKPGAKTSGLPRKSNQKSTAGTYQTASGNIESGGLA